MKLVIAEKPSVGISIASVIGADTKKNGYMEGNGYIVTWCRGHMAKLEEPVGEWRLEELPLLPSDKIVPKEDTLGQFKIVKSLMERRDVTGLVCATDAGREGEAIFRYVYIAAGCRKPFERLWISSMTDAAIKEGFEHLRPGREYDKLYHAAVARDKADTLVGINGTRLFSLLYNQWKPPLSVGRVQTPTLYMIVKREQDISHFVKEKFFRVHITARFNGNEKPLEAVSKNISSESEAVSLAKACMDARATVTAVEEQVKTTASPRLYDLTSLQRDCNRLFGYTAQQTLDAVQELYEAKLCTYPRTDSQYLTDDMLDMVSGLIDITIRSVPFRSLLSGSHDKEIGKCINNKKVSDHHAIIPTDQIRPSSWDKLTGTQANVLGLICVRLLAATARKQTYKATKVSLECQGKTFQATGKVILDNGFKDYEEAWKKSENFGALQEDTESDEKEQDRELPAVSKGDTGRAASSLTEHYTQPPKHYTEASILTAMEHAGADEVTEEVERKGLGTTATRSAIIENLIAKGYLVRNKKQLLPTDRAYRLMEVIPDDLKSPTMTAEMENTLSLVAQGRASAEVFLNEMTAYVTRIVEENRRKKDTDHNPFGSGSPQEVLGNCPKCGAQVKQGNWGAWCSGKCGMNVSRIFGKQLTDEQVSSLLNGKAVAFANGRYINKVFPEIELFSCVKDGKEVRGFQWKTESRRKKR